MAFFTYIAGGFGKNIDTQIRDIVEETSVHGSAVSVSNVISLVEQAQTAPIPHPKIKEIFSLDRQILRSDLIL